MLQPHIATMVRATDTTTAARPRGETTRYIYLTTLAAAPNLGTTKDCNDGH